MKWVFLAITIGMIGPLASWLRASPQHAPKIWILMGSLPFMFGFFHLHVAPISWAGWPGYVQGLEISLLDTVAVAVYFSLPRQQREPIPFRFSMGLYLLAVVFSIFQSETPTASAFYAWQLARMFLIYSVVVKGCANPKLPYALVTGMVLGVAFQAVLALMGRFQWGQVQATGSFGHQNSLGMATQFVLMPAFALLLAGRRGWQPPLAVFAGAIIVVLTASRGTMGFAALGLCTVFLISALRGWSGRKARVLLIAAISLSIVTPLALTSLDQRFAAKPINEEEYDERAALEKAARSMLSDYPLGVGANNFVTISATRGYGERAGLIWNSFGAHVHNLYWLTAAEAGYFGLFALIAFLIRPLWVFVRCSLRCRRDMRADLLVGAGVAILTVCAQSFYEFVLVNFSLQYMLSMSIGLVGGLAQQLRYWSRTMNVQSGALYTDVASKPVYLFSGDAAKVGR